MQDTTAARAAITTPHVLRWFARWTCGCNTLSPADDIPARCPAHGKWLIERPEMLECAADLPLGVQAGVAP